MLKVNRKPDVLLHEHAGMVEKNKPTPGTFGQRLKAARKAAKMTQPQLARRVGMSQSNLSELENDLYPTSSFTPRLAETLKVASIWLAEGRGQREHSYAPAEAPLEASSSAHEIAEALTVSIQAIADKWGIQDARDLLDPSPEARSRVEHAIATAGFKAVAAKPVLKHMDDDRPGSTRARSGSN
jgi:transcriptional regulator with XRE-family HTH domain